MHTYLRAIGFDNYFSSEYELNNFLDEIFLSYEERKSVKEDNNRVFLEISKSFGPNMGIRICGQMDEHGFHRLYYYPYLHGTGVTTQAELTVEKKVNGECFTGLCDDGRVGMSLIFFVQNPADFRNHTILNQIFRDHTGTTLTGLCRSGIILLPGKKAETKKQKDKEYVRCRENLVAAARSGDQEAIENLTLEDMDTYAMLSRRILHEDILTIVDSYMMPFGAECDMYQILGTIIFYTKVYNELTKEALYQMTLNVNDMMFDVCVSERDLLGDPEVGRRFKGNIWLQGNILFE